MKIQIASDIHLEFLSILDYSKLVTNKNNADILALLGDISVCGNKKDLEKYDNFLEYLSPKYKHIFVVSGNHEYYSQEKLTMTDINRLIRSMIKKYNNVTFLNGNCFIVNEKNHKYIFCGGTLWTNIPNDMKSFIKQSMNDYFNIYVKRSNEIRKIEPDDVIKLHKQYLKKINLTIKEYKNKKNVSLIMLTHHKPYVNEDKPLNGLDFAYQTNLNNIIKEPIKLWCYGHTHIKDKTVISGTKIYSNPKGYPYQKTSYENDFIINL